MGAQREVNGVKYEIIETSSEKVRVVWEGRDERPLRTFSAAANEAEADGGKVRWIMNGGIFEPGGIPSGLLIQGGRERIPVNRRQGVGNFYLQPNGVFYFGRQKAGVVKTEEWPVAGDWVGAVQSGPLLLRNGVVHPLFRKESTSRLHRNGVGVKKDGTILLAISISRSPKYPNLYEFAMMFRSLGCDDALFLDGDISRLEMGGAVPQDGQSYGSFLVVME